MLVLIQQLFISREIRKRYLAIVCGYTNDFGIIDYPLINERGEGAGSE
ncbi:MAG: hypothetical protein SVU94_05930 [Bacteroidota bacterium]|nr:hypothetical protein [Bacteroidota bacterium]